MSRATGRPLKGFLADGYENRAHPSMPSIATVIGGMRMTILMETMNIFA